MLVLCRSLLTVAQDVCTVLNSRMRVAGCSRGVSGPGMVDSRWTLHNYPVSSVK